VAGITEINLQYSPTKGNRWLLKPHKENNHKKEPGATGNKFLVYFYMEICIIEPMEVDAQKQISSPEIRQQDIQADSRAIISNKFITFLT